MAGGLPPESTRERIEVRYPWLPQELRADCALLVGCFEALSTKDVERAIALWHDDGEYHSAFAAAEGGVPYQGKGGLRKYFANVFELFEEWQLRPTNFVGSDGRILALCEFRFAGRGSAVQMSQEIGTVWIVDDGLIRRGFGYLTLDAAIDGMAALCGRQRAEIEVLVSVAEHARASHQEGRP